MTAGPAQNEARAFGAPLVRMLGMVGLGLLVLARSGRAFAAGSPPSAGTLDGVAREAARLLGATPGRSVVVAAPLASDQSAPKSTELALQMGALVASKIGGGARAHAQTAEMAPARAIAGRASALVYVQSAIELGDLRVTVDVYPPMANAWDRIRNPLPIPMGHAFASTKIDAEVRSFLTPLRLEKASVRRVRQDEGAVLAAACGDADGGAAWALVSRERVALGRVRAGAFVVERAAPFSQWAVRAAVPMREPLATAIVTDGRVYVGSTERGGLWLGRDFTTATPLSGLPVWGGHGIACLSAEPSAGAFDGAPFDCAASRDPKPIMAVPAPRFDAFAAASFARSSGSPADIVAVREPSGTLRFSVRDAGNDAVGIADGAVGAELAAGDLDQDGAPEIATTTEGPDDAINVLSVSAKAEASLRLHLPTPAPVRALAICPPETDGAPALIAVVGDEVWIVRAALSSATP